MPNNINTLNFSWIELNVIAGSARPSNYAEFEFIRDQGIKIIISLESRYWYDIYDQSLNYFKFYSIPVKDFAPPSVQQVKSFWQIAQIYKDKNAPILVHCGAGCGRTGTFLALWLLLRKEVKNASIAINQIRKLRPCSIESDSQGQFLRNFDINRILK
ncbi:MAG: protein-tyrosine phosphatase family protein [Candidatus Hodarchaeota archaeon]